MVFLNLMLPQELVSTYLPLIVVVITILAHVIRIFRDTLGN
jgi:hypothetical protein